VTPGAIKPAPAVANPRVAGAAKPLTANGPEVSTSHRLPELIRVADGLAESIRQFEQQLAHALDTFERDGGRPAVESFVAQAQRVQDNPQSVDDLELLVGWIPQACRLLETELVLVNLLTARASDASR
jgi:hypothetical protein